ncbi:bridging integrator [Anaeramoeba flamelloides]|uniref:Bridging integrator n=1 Tax=Anaeramoeba flamelloides TaxID=1746091 RepID=A0AAV7ZTK2_9EUKA|nr:bridging integrator [Anaeramoeba flamelloides]
MSKSQKAKRFWKRGHQKLLQKVRKAEQTVDKDFNEKVEQFQELKTNTNKMLTLKLDEDLNTFFEHHPAEEKEDKENVEKLSKALKSSSKLLEDDLEEINKHCILKIESKVNSLMKLEKNIKERNHLLTEHDFHKRKLENAKKKKEKNKIELTEKQFHTAKKIYKKTNQECKEKITKHQNQKDFFLTKIHLNLLGIYKAILESLNQKRTNLGLEQSSNSSSNSGEEKKVNKTTSESESKSKSKSEKSEKKEQMPSDNGFTETTLEPIENQEN